MNLKHIPTVRHRWTPSQDEGIDCSLDQPLTQQHFKDDCDINHIIKRHGGIPPAAPGSPQPIYMDFASVPDFQQAVIAVQEAREAFMELPADLRKRFRNDPAELLGFLNDENNRQEAIELGLVNKPEPALDVVDPAAPLKKDDNKAS